MSRIWCWLGLHDWLNEYRVRNIDEVWPTGRTCWRCHKYSEIH